MEDNDLLDDESKRHLGALSYLGGGDINVRGILAGEDGDGETSDLQKAAEPAETADVKDADAVSLIDDEHFYWSHRAQVYPKDLWVFYLFCTCSKIAQRTCNDA